MPAGLRCYGGLAVELTRLRRYHGHAVEPAGLQYSVGTLGLPSGAGWRAIVEGGHASEPAGLRYHSERGVLWGPAGLRY